MGAFLLTYSIVWSVLIIYVVSLDMAQRRLTRAAKALQCLLARHNKECSESTWDRDAI
ncbi:unnamed protein product, partial [marine sediment metagenome]